MTIYEKCFKMFLQEFIFRLQTGNLFRGCTGFDGGFEVRVAIRDPRCHVKRWNL